MVVAYAWSSPDAAESVMSFFVGGLIEALGDQTPLDGDVLRAVDRETFVHAPAGRAVVDDDVLLITAFDGVHPLSSGVSEPDAEEAHDHLVGFDVELVVRKTDASAGGRLGRR